MKTDLDMAWLLSSRVTVTNSEGVAELLQSDVGGVGYRVADDQAGDGAAGRAGHGYWLAFIDLPPLQPPCHHSPRVSIRTRGQPHAGARAASVRRPCGRSATTPASASRTHWPARHPRHPPRHPHEGLGTFAASYPSGVVAPPKALVLAIVPVIELPGERLRETKDRHREAFPPFACRTPVVPIEIHCSGCSRVHGVTVERAGESLKCDSCGAVMTVPQTQAFAMSTTSRADEIDPFLAMLLECQRNVGRLPRKLSRVDRAYFAIKPSWMCWLGLDELSIQYRDQTLLRDRGTVVWGYLVQANSLLFDPHGRENHPADVVYSPDPHFADKPYLLGEYANGLYRLKGTEPSDPKIREIAAMITNELSRPLQMMVPHAMTQGRPVYMSALYIHRKHLPLGYLQRSLFPVLIDLHETKATMMVPSRFWGQTLLAFWNRG
jgi:hypothetical protein